MRPEVGALVMTVNGIAELFYHWNVRTPRWLGTIVQRPESHCVHHQEQLHRHNYADLPVFDLLFGTYLNPKAWAGRRTFSWFRFTGCTTGPTPCISIVSRRRNGRSVKPKSAQRKSAGKSWKRARPMFFAPAKCNPNAITM